MRLPHRSLKKQKFFRVARLRLCGGDVQSVSPSVLGMCIPTDELERAKTELWFDWELVSSLFRKHRAYQMVFSVLPEKKQATLVATTCQYFTLTADGHKQEGEKRK